MGATMWRLWLYFNSDGKWKKDSFLWEWMRFIAMSWLLAPHPLWSAFTPATLDPGGSLESPWMGLLAASQSHTACFPIQSLYLTGDTSPGPNPNSPLFENVPGNYFTGVSTSVHTHAQIWSFVLLSFCFPFAGLLTDRIKSMQWGVYLGTGSVEAVAPGTKDIVE